MADKEMSFLEHLEDLRWHLLRSITAILIAALAAFWQKILSLMYCFWTKKQIS